MYSCSDIKKSALKLSFPPSVNRVPPVSDQAGPLLPLRFHRPSWEIGLVLIGGWRIWLWVGGVDAIGGLKLAEARFWGVQMRETSKRRSPEPLDFFIWTVEDVGLWLEEINLGPYRSAFEEHGVNGEYLEGLSTFTTEQILRFIRRCHMKWGDFITLCKELRRIKVACLKGEQEIRRPWWAPACLSVVFVKVAKKNRQSRVVSLKLEP
ncbi:hypothetical protein LUZ60_006007 [Juncus effusus]|nr:hypothetical protein LUZ60_006007 [Juncus effusus]